MHSSQCLSCNVGHIEDCEVIGVGDWFARHTTPHPRMIATSARHFDKMLTRRNRETRNLPEGVLVSPRGRR